MGVVVFGDIQTYRRITHNYINIKNCNYKNKNKKTSDTSNTNGNKVDSIMWTYNTNKQNLDLAVSSSSAYCRYKNKDYLKITKV